MGQETRAEVKTKTLTAGRGGRRREQRARGYTRAHPHWCVSCFIKGRQTGPSEYRIQNEGHEGVADENGRLGRGGEGRRAGRE
eukprot:5055682-Pleurochrysis_carterae.AAC.1